MSNISISPSEPIVLDPKELRTITRAALEGLDHEAGERIGDITQEDLEICIALFEKDIKDHAESGYYEASWDFRKLGFPIEHVNQITAEFRRRHNGLMIITDSGTLNVTVSWKKRSH